MGVGSSSASEWRITSINESYQFSPTYPSVLAVPRTVSDAVLKVAGQFRTNQRIPILSWRDKRTGATICRSSQPYVGLGQKQCAQDIFLVQAIASANPSSSKLVVVDARPWRNAVAQKTVGRAGYEMTEHYETRSTSTRENTKQMISLIEPCVHELSECRIVFMGIENIHMMRKSFLRLQELCLSKPTEKWQENVAQTRWLEHLALIMESAVEIVNLIRNEKTSVLVHCSDGWDRTPQLTALAQLLLDPYYRTFQGFQVLIEKEWISFGHKFADRVGRRRRRR